MNIQDEAYSEAMDEIKRLKAQHKEMLLKHAREQGVALSALETALKKIELVNALLTRAADALENCLPALNAGVLKITSEALITELRKAAQ